ncbi:pyridoxamine 5'-phosphate oxidase family protein [Cyclobacterium jeungdonense]|uniref:Pyridoxamine 5'-phosphate oxidase family protein n=1 Tax=Cyclobacterium jeungdonense TaxID=708087 RepID=A0ABT8C693_9BACT|nr:pyridoxamine 5'-phosphate oxidase family protein [Cyclobacterium jeungdonense]MDN3687567.1 pyridoxamine 5'-phosphate oxidase family protein [Cyclobacterium jeungdonense]
MSSPEHKKLIWNLIKDIKVGMLVTKSTKDGESMRARPMSLVQDAYDGTLFFYTSKSAAKAFEIKQDTDTCLTFTNPKDNVYVSLTGKAMVTEDRELIDKYWNPWVAAWFENGKDDPELAMLKVKINKGEHWDSTNNKLVQIFELAKSNIKESSTPKLGENEKFGTD